MSSVLNNLRRKQTQVFVTNVNADPPRRHDSCH